MTAIFLFLLNPFNFQTGYRPPAHSPTRNEIYAHLQRQNALVFMLRACVTNSRLVLLLLTSASQSTLFGRSLCFGRESLFLDILLLLLHCDRELSFYFGGKTRHGNSSREGERRHPRLSVGRSGCTCQTPRGDLPHHAPSLPPARSLLTYLYHCLSAGSYGPAWRSRPFNHPY